MTRGSTARTVSTAVGFVPLLLSALLVQPACDRKPKPPPPVTAAPPIGPDGDALSTATHPTGTASVPAQPPACVVAYATPPPSGGPFYQPGDDVSDAPVPINLPTGASLTINVRRTGHDVTFTGPAVFRPCTRAEPEVVLLAEGQASTDRNSNVRPGSEVYIGTPGFVAIIGKATVKVTAGIEATTYDATDSATFTNLDQSRTVDPGAKGAFKRYEDGAILITRCGVQITAMASADAMLSGLAKDAGPPLPSASIGILTAQHIKHARERTLDCAFAAAFALACDHWARTGEKAGGAACKRSSYAGLAAHVVTASSVWPAPPGSPPLDAGAVPRPSAAPSLPAPAPPSSTALAPPP